MKKNQFSTNKESRQDFQCAVYMREHGINVFSNSLDMIQILSEGPFVPFIPEYHCVVKRAPTDYSLIFVESNSFSAELSENQKVLKITGSKKEITDGKTIPYMIHFMLEQQRQEKCQATLKAAGVSIGQKGILLIGKRGSGKTSISLELCRKYNYSLIGNDLVLIGFDDNGGHLLGGTKIFTLRFTSVKYYNTDLQKYFSSLKKSDEWIDKVNILPQRLGVSTEKKLIKIQGAYYVHLFDNSSVPLFTKRINSSEDLYMGRLYLYEELTRYIRGGCIPVLKGFKPELANYLPSLDRQEYHEWRVRLIDWLIESLGLYYVSGSIDRICNFINNEVDNLNKKTPETV